MNSLISVAKSLPSGLYKIFLFLVNLMKAGFFKFKRNHLLLGGVVVLNFLLNYLNKSKKTGKPLVLANTNKYDKIFTSGVFNQVHSPNIFIPYGISQTIAVGYFDGNKPKYPYEKEYVVCDNGDRILVQIPVTSSTSKKILIIIPGLSSDIESYYIDNFITESLKENYQIFFVNHRGLGENLPNKRSYSAGCSGNIKLVYDHILSKFNEEVEVYFVGFSMGGNLLTKFLSENSGDKRIKGSVAVCPCIHLEDAIDKISKYAFGFLNYILSLTLKKNFYQRSEYLLLDKSHEEKQEILKKVSRANSVNEFDDSWTSSHFGFKDSKDYYQQVSAVFKLDKIGSPLMLFYTEDDPMIPFKKEYNEYAKGNENVIFCSVKFGGHLGCFLNDLWFPKPKLHKFVFDFLNNL